MQSTILGPYPRVGTEAGKRLRSAVNRYYRGEIGPEGLLPLQVALTEEIAGKMVSAGITLPHYGMVDVHDELTWPLESVNGIRFGGMKKIFHTNTHYREPVVEDEISRKGRFLSTLHEAAQEALKDKGGDSLMKVEFPGPYTMAKHSVLGEGAPYNDVEGLAMAYAALLSEELSELQGDPSISTFQFNEPSIIAYERDHTGAGMVREVYQEMLRNLDPRKSKAVWTFYGKYTPESLELLFSLPVDVVGLDLVWDPYGAAGVSGNEEEITKFLRDNPQDKGIGIGIINSGDSGFMVNESTGAITERLRALGGYVDLGRSIITSNATLEHLPEEVAEGKLGLICEVARGLEG